MCVCARARGRAGVCVFPGAEVCFDCVLVLCFVMGYVFQFGETSHKEYISIIDRSFVFNVPTCRVEIIFYYRSSSLKKQHTFKVIIIIIFLVFGIQCPQYF